MYYFPFAHRLPHSSIANLLMNHSIIVSMNHHRGIFACNYSLRLFLACLHFLLYFFFFGCNGDLSAHTLTSWATAWNLPACNLSSIRLLSKACVWSCVWIFMNYRFVGFSMNPLYYSIFTILQKYQLGVNFVMCTIITFYPGTWPHCASMCWLRGLMMGL